MICRPDVWWVVAESCRPLKTVETRYIAPLTLLLRLSKYSTDSGSIHLGHEVVRRCLFCFILSSRYSLPILRKSCSTSLEGGPSDKTAVKINWEYLSKRASVLFKRFIFIYFSLECSNDGHLC